MWELFQRAIPELARGFSTSLALVAARPSPQTCSPVLQCPEVHRCPDCVCQGSQRACPSFDCSYWSPFTHGVVVALVAVITLAGVVWSVQVWWSEVPEVETVDSLSEARRQLAVVRSRHVEDR